MRVAILAVIACAAFGQVPPKQNATVALTNIPSAAAVEQMTSMVKTVGGILDVSFDPASSSFSMRGPQNTLGLAAWLLHAADKPAGWQPSTGDNAVSYQLQPGGYPIDDRKPVARVLYLRNSNSRDAIEIVTVLRVVGEIQLVVKCDQPGMVAVRGTASDVALAEWLTGKLDLAANAGAYESQSANPDSDVLKLAAKPDGAEDLVRVFYLNPAMSQANAIRLRNQIRQLTNATIFNKTSPPAIVVRGNAVLMAQVGQIIGSPQGH